MASDKRRKWFRSVLRDIAWYVIAIPWAAYWLEPLNPYLRHPCSHTDIAKICGIYIVGIPLIALLVDGLPAWRKARRLKRAK